MEREAERQTDRDREKGGGREKKREGERKRKRDGERENGALSKNVMCSPSLVLTHPQ